MRKHKFKSKRIKDLRDLNKKSFSPIISVILSLVIAVIIVGSILSWGLITTSNSLDKSQEIYKEDPTLTGYIYTSNPQPESYIVKNLSDKDVIITKYEIVAPQDSEILNKPITLDDPVNLNSGSMVSVPIICNPDESFKVNLITSDGKYITVPINNSNYQSNSCFNNTEIPDPVCLGITDNGSGKIEEDPFVICSVDDLNNVRNGLGKHYKLGKNLDLGVSPYNEGEGFEPIGSDDSGFEGSFNGNNYTISNLYINLPENDNIGLFGYIKYTESKMIEIKNLILTDVNIIGSNNVGSIVGNFMWFSILSTVHSSGTISGNSAIGGLIGINNRAGFNSDGGDINSSSFNGNIYCGSDCGGLVGLGYGNIENSYSNIKIISSESDVGGIVGYKRGDIINSYSIGEIVSSEGNDIGGLVGYNRGGITDSYSFCNVSGNNYVGGLVGYNGELTPPPIRLPEGIIFSSYSAGSVIGNENYGGLLGGGDISRIYYIIYDTNTSGQSDNDGRGVPKTTTEMKTQDTFTDWNFTDIWGIEEGITYPYLRNNTQDPLPE